MGEFVRICGKNELPAEGQAIEITAGERVICLANVQGTVTAIDNVCLHRGGPLAQGVVDGDKIVCPWHGWQYRLKTGEATHNPLARVAVYALKLDGEDVFAEI